jgi:hypothetical protein
MWPRPAAIRLRIASREPWAGRSGVLPNLLVHYAVQVVTTRAACREADLRWILLGVLVPDLPWIVQRVASTFAPAIDVYELRLYVIAQASLMISLVACAAFAVLARRTRTVLGILAANAFLHLLLDACETKWANGVHLFAPFSWAIWNLGLFWPESPLALALTLAGAAVTLGVALWRPGRLEPTALRSPRRWLLAGLAGAVWLLAPIAFLDAVEASDSHFAATLRNVDARPGRGFELDRSEFALTRDGWVLHAWTNEDFPVASDSPRAEGTVSVRGRFVDERRVEILEAHHHESWRDTASYAGLALLALAWLRPAPRLGTGRRVGRG